MSNISLSVLRFRHEYDTSEHILMSHNQYRWQHMQAYFGILVDKSAVQSHGYVQAQQGRMVTFPNFQQHRVEPFELEDKTKPGHRRILALFLVDPERYIPSTKWIPPQQAEIVADNLGEAVRERLPWDVSLSVANALSGGVMSQAEADRYAKIFMDERKGLEGALESRMAKVNFCEH
jgi:hypothetical protein